MRLTKSEAKRLIVAKDLHMTPAYNKYGNKKTVIDGITFDSVAESIYYQNLKILISAGFVKYFLMQIPFYLPGGVKYKCDFMVVWKDGAIEYADVKGHVTAMFKLKKKQVEALYPITIKCVKRVGKSKSFGEI